MKVENRGHNQKIKNEGQEIASNCRDNALFGHKAASEWGEIRGFMLEIKKIFW